MHLWPTIKFRDSWKLSSITKVDRTISKMRSQKRAKAAALQQNLLEKSGTQADSSPKGPTLPYSDESCLSAFWRDFLFVATCCCCLGACMDGSRLLQLLLIYPPIGRRLLQLPLIRPPNLTNWNESV